MSWSRLLPFRPALRWLLTAFVLLAVPALASAQVVDPYPVDNLLQRFNGVLEGWSSAVYDTAVWLFWSLAVLSFTWTMCMMVFKRADFGELFAELVRFIVLTGLFWWLLQSGSGLNGLIDDILTSMKLMGERAVENAALRPASLLESAYQVFIRVAQQSAEESWKDADKLIAMALSTLIVGLVALAAVSMMIIKMLMWILAYGGLFLLGFGGARWTSGIAINYYKHVLAVGISYFVMLLLSVTGESFLREYSTSVVNNVTLPNLAIMLVASILLVALLVRVPQLIAAIVLGARMGGGEGGTFSSTVLATGGSAVASGASQAGRGAQDLYNAWRAHPPSSPASTQLDHAMGHATAAQGAGMGPVMGTPVLYPAEAASAPTSSAFAPVPLHRAAAPARASSQDAAPAPAAGSSAPHAGRIPAAAPAAAQARDAQRSDTHDTPPTRDPSRTAALRDEGGAPGHAPVASGAVAATHLTTGQLAAGTSSMERRMTDDASTAAGAERSVFDSRAPQGVHDARPSAATGQGARVPDSGQDLRDATRGMHAPVSADASLEPIARQAGPQGDGGADGTPRTDPSRLAGTVTSTDTALRMDTPGADVPALQSDITAGQRGSVRRSAASAPVEPTVDGAMPLEGVRSASLTDRVHAEATDMRSETVLDRGATSHGAGSARVESPAPGRVQDPAHTQVEGPLQSPTQTPPLQPQIVKNPAGTPPVLDAGAASPRFEAGAGATQRAAPAQHTVPLGTPSVEATAPATVGAGEKAVVDGRVAAPEAGAVRPADMPATAAAAPVSNVSQRTPDPAVAPDRGTDVTAAERVRTVDTDASRSGVSTPAQPVVAPSTGAAAPADTVGHRPGTGHPQPAGASAQLAPDAATSTPTAAAPGTPSTAQAAADRPSGDAVVTSSGTQARGGVTPWAAARHDAGPAVAPPATDRVDTPDASVSGAASPRTEAGHAAPAAGPGAHAAAQPKAPGASMPHPPAGASELHLTPAPDQGDDDDR